jgi:hypothetical protein
VTLSGFAAGQTLATSGVTGQPACSTTATVSSPVGNYPITCTPGSLAASHYTFTMAPGTLTVTATNTISTSSNGPVTVAPGQSLAIGAGATVSGPLRVQSGGALDVEGGTVTGPVTVATGAGVRMCGATITGPVTITGTSGPVVFGDDDGPRNCAGNKITGAVTITGNTSGVEFDGNTVTGKLTITGNTGTLAPPDTGAVDAGNNTVTGPQQIQH